MEEVYDDRAYRRYFVRKRAGERTRLAVMLDEILLRGILLLGVYLFFTSRFAGDRVRTLLLTGIGFLLCLLGLRIFREVALERFTRKELARIRRELLCDRLLLLNGEDAAALCRRICVPGETPVLLQKSKPASGDDLYAAVRAHRGQGRLGLLAVGGFDEEAAALAARSRLLTLYSRDALLKAGEQAGLGPGPEEIRAYIQHSGKRKRKRPRGALAGALAGRSGKYLLAGALLLGLSFLTGYALYYRLLAGLCVSLAGAGFVLGNRHPRETY